MNISDSILLSLLILLLGCSKPDCSCIINQQQIYSNDSIIASFSPDRLWDRMNETSLDEATNDVMRLSVVSAFADEESAMYKLSKNDSDIQFEIKYFNKIVDGQWIDSLNRKESYRLSLRKWNDLEDKLDQSCFWTMNTDPTEQTLDGTSYIFEVKLRKNNSCTSRDYHVLYRNLGYDTDELRGIVHDFIDLHQ